MNNTFGLPERTINELSDYFKTKPEIDLVKIYGSRAKGTYRNGSDIDFAIWFNAPHSVSRILFELDELPTPYKFDVTDYEALTHEGMKKSIDTDGKIFYEKNFG